ncbi:glycosyl transferase family 1 [Williamsia limnetica]|uniref:Glycosyl transferase family 1 n=1 Tax=Williamsia limnetica TaxID=882452 RepID=A0A318RW81_WILLI|nr:glycosyl transferase family 1 [Williamsia limnetica]
MLSVVFACLKSVVNGNRFGVVEVSGAQLLPPALRVLVWHVHGSWSTSFVQGRHTYLIPVTPDLDEWGRGRMGRPWPASAIEVQADQLATADIDVVVLQRPHEIELTERWTGRRPGRDLPAIYVEHNTPHEHAARTEHVLAGRSDIPLVHVTHFNRLMWDNGRCPTTVVPHGVVDPGPQYTGELSRAATMINEPIRRWRITGTDLLPVLSNAAPIDVFGIGCSDLDDPRLQTGGEVVGIGDLDLHTLHAEVARRRVFVHTARWTSLGLSLIEAMHLGMPVVAVASTEAPRAVPSAAGIVSADPEVLGQAIARFAHDLTDAQLAGKAAREWALREYGLGAFVSRWEDLLHDVTR